VANYKITPEQLEAIKAQLMRDALDDFPSQVKLARIFTDGSLEEYARLVEVDFNEAILSDSTLNIPDWGISNAYAGRIWGNGKFYPLWVPFWKLVLCPIWKERYDS